MSQTSTGISVKTAEELQIMRHAGKIVAGLLTLMQSQVRPGISTRELDESAEAFIRSQGAEPAFKGYYGFPCSICASVNEEVVHGIPGPRILQEGDIIGVDVGVKYKEFYSDAARTFAVGDVSKDARKLLKLTREAMNCGIAQAIEGHYVSDISHAVQTYAEANGLSVVRQYVGHGIGRKLHEEPQVPNYGKPGNGSRLLAGMTLAIEPMLNLGGHEVRVLKDGWTVVTKDGRLSGHFEQTIVVGKTKPEILTENGF